MLLKNRILNFIIIGIMGLVILGAAAGSAYCLASGYSRKGVILSRVDLRRYFEKAMALFESGKYREAIAVFENLIEIEKSQNESYFTPFAEIYIDKAKDRLDQRLLAEDRRWKKIKKEVISEAEKIAEEKAREAAEKEKRLALSRQREEEERKKALREKEKREKEELENKVNSIYKEALDFYNKRNYPAAIVDLKKIKELSPAHPLSKKADDYIKLAQREIKRKEERELLARMEAARIAQLEMEREKRRKAMEEELRRREKARLEMQKARLKRIFEERLKEREKKERLAKIDNYLKTIRMSVDEKKFDEAEATLEKAMRDFPENDRFKDIAHYIEMEKLRMEEKALMRAREITEEKMLLEVAKKHMLPEIKVGRLEETKKITPLVKVPEIRKRLKIPISVDFKDLELDYVLAFLSDATGVNIIPSSQIDMSEKKVTVKLKDMPLEDALRYILKTQGLVYRIEEDAVWVASKEELDKEKIDTRVYFLNQGIGRFVEFGKATVTKVGSGSSSGSSEVRTIKDLLENAVDWPKESKLTLDERTGALIVSNTPSNLEVIENLLYNLDVTPIQVLIEARFLEVKVTDVNELGIEWKLNSDWGVKQNNSKQNLHGFASGSGVDFSDFTRGDEGFNLTYQGILSHPQFQAVLHALEENQNVKTLSAPTITTLNNQTATLEVTDEYIYPTRYEVSLVQFDINGDGDFDDAGETEWANIPQDFVTRDVGILLHVKPSVGVDKKTITLSLTPEVSEDAGTFSYSGDVSIPQFKTRNLSTSVILESGETVILGGLIKESKTRVTAKVPFLGNLPIVGSFFKKNTDNTERRNLLIFVTAKVMNRDQNMVAEASGLKELKDKIRREQ